MSEETDIQIPEEPILYGCKLPRCKFGGDYGACKNPEASAWRGTDALEWGVCGREVMGIRFCDQEELE
jgi:hypothetical protein